MSGEGSRPSRLTAKIATVAAMKPGTISYRALPVCSHSSTVSAPTSIPAIAPLRVIRFHNSDRITTGPNAAPKPAQA